MKKSKSFKIAIHDRPGSFSDKWIEYCEKKGVPYQIVSCFDSDIIEQLKSCKALMWHFHHNHRKDVLFAKELMFSLEHTGIKVFPDFNTAWHFDDKIAQKYLLEAAGVDLVKSYVFYEKEKALDWASTTSYPKVFKLRRGAGSQNVQLIKSKKEAKIVIQRMFGNGIPSYDKGAQVKESFWKLNRDKSLKSIGRVGKYVLKYLMPARFQPHHSIEKGYAYFQDFIPGLSFDIRVVIIGKRAFAIRRRVRENDFRASGSGMLDYEKETIPELAIEKAFSISDTLGTQCIAVDFLINRNEVLLVELSYSFNQDAYLKCPGYWDRGLNWNEEKILPEYFMIEDFIESVQ